MPEVSRTYSVARDTKTSIHEITDGIYRISGFVDEFGITFNQFLIDDEKPTLIHTGPVGLYERVAEKVREVIPRRNWHTSHSCILKATSGEEWSFWNLRIQNCCAAT